MKGLTMTTVSVQPTTSEPNEREAFREWWNTQIGESVTWTILERFAALSAWQHQEKRIDKLESELKAWKESSKNWERDCMNNLDAKKSLQAKLNEKDNFIKLMDVFGGYEKLQAKCVLLEKQNTVAVEALESIEDWKFGWDGDCGVTSKASEALAEINRLQEGE